MESGDLSLLDRLLRLAREPACPMHMPGHKRNPALPGALPFSIDITEIDGFDNLSQADGILAEGMTSAARVFGADRAFYLVNGGTAGILAAVRAHTRPGDFALIERNCHRSVYHAVELCGLNPVFLTPRIDARFGVACGVSPDDVREAIEKNPAIRLAVITSPSYEGVLSDVSAIARELSARGVLLLVDAAHGAHLGFHPAFPKSALQCGADLSVVSLHKTLCGLTQTALALTRGEAARPDALARQLTVFQTSSPSYPLMASIDLCVRLLDERGEELFDRYAAGLNRLFAALGAMRRIRPLCAAVGGAQTPPPFFALDPGKLYLCTRGTDLTGPRLAEALRQIWQIEPEMTAPEGVLLMTSPFDAPENLERVAEALLSIDARCAEADAPPPPPDPAPTTQVMRPDLALQLPAAPVSLKACAGRVAAEYAWAYPPGIPIVAPGERIDEEQIASIRRHLRFGVRVFSTSGLLPDRFRVLEGEA